MLTTNLNLEAEIKLLLSSFSVKASTKALGILRCMALQMNWEA